MIKNFMINKLYKHSLLLVPGVISTVLIVAGINSYPGSKFLYLLFSAIFSLMLFSSFGKHTHYGYLFLAIALWLGYWVKITVHLIFKYPYVEPIGYFDGSAAAWDSVLWVAIAASAGVLLGKLLFTLMGHKYSRVVDITQAKVPVWYQAIRSWVWPISLTAIICVAVTNMILGIQQIGLVPRTILPWPLNALIAIQVSIGSALWLTVLLWWDVSLKKNISMPIYALLVEASIATASLLSRGVYIFHALPQFFALFENRQWLVGVSKVKVVALILAFVVLMVVSIAGVTTFRAYLFPHAGGFTTEEQKRLTRLEVIEGGIARVKKLILQGEPQEGHLRELLAEKTQLEKGLKGARLEVLEGGIARVEKLILQGERQEEHLRELLAEKMQLEKDLSKNSADPESNFHNSLVEIERQRRSERLEVIEGGIARVKQMISQGEPQEGHLRELLAEKTQLEKVQSQHNAKNDVVVVKAARQDALTRDAKNEAKSELVGANEKHVNNVATVVSNSDNFSENKKKLLSELYLQVHTGTLQRILSLGVDRWIGLEGVMAVSAYPKKNRTLLFDAIKEKREIGKTTKFQDICNSHYRWIDTNNWQFASLPGAAAFLYFSGSLWVVLLGMAMFTFLLQLSEQLVFSLTSNPLLCSLFGLTLANTITQFGITPRQDIPFYSMIFGFVLIVSMVQSDKVYKVIRKYRSYHGDRGAV